MEQLLQDGLAPGLGRKDDGQISHGLNLVLKLNSTSTMLLLLAGIRQAQRKIDAGLRELNFVHFARFLPTRDNRSLQVITEFDGPLAPYVLDFAIEIGDVFDLLLSHTDGAEHIVPIAEHAAEFLAFVEENNTVTVLPGVSVRDWPLYAAYPEQTVLDITGPRSDLPIPKADRWATAVQREDVQGNILKGYGAERGRHFLLRVLHARKARRWLAHMATLDEAIQPGLTKVTSSEIWATKPNLMLNVGLTYVGMEKLKIPAPWRASFPDAFKQGAVKRAEDNFDFGTNAPEHWWLGGPQQEPNIHVIVSLYCSLAGERDFEPGAEAIVDALPGAGLALLVAHDAVRRGGMDWFGYADGIANPRIATACPMPDDEKDLQPAATAGEFVLGADYKNIYGGNSLGALPAALATNGSFCAVRVLAQDRTNFDAVLHAEAMRLNVHPHWLAAKLMGRWFDGAPLSLHPDAAPTDPAQNKRNDFDFAPSYEYPGTPMDHAGERCPVGAHIRRSNPRTARVAGSRYTRRLMRRGMHYDISNPQGQREVGLFGLFMCADLERQFEFIQRQWINGDRFTAGIRGTRDPFAGTPKSDCDTFEIPMPNASPLQVRLPQLVRTRGSLYLFMPGLNALRQLETFATTDWTAADLFSLAIADVVTSIATPSQKLESALASVDAQFEQHEVLEMALLSVGNPPLETGTKGVPSRNLRFDPRRRDFQINPYPVYAQFRSTEPVHFSPLYDGWFVFGYDDVVRVCTEDDHFSAASLDSTAPRGLFTLDEPEHKQVLAVIFAAWNKAAADAPKLVESSIVRTLAAIGSRPCFDLVDDFARPVPRDVYFDILGGKGIDADERLQLDALARTVMKHHDHTFDFLQRMDGTIAGAKLGARLGWMLAQAALPGSAYAGSFLGYLAPAVQSIGGIGTAVMTLLNLTVAGYMSVEFLLATGIRRLLIDPATGWDVVKTDPSQLPRFIEEMRRTDHALSVVDRFAKQDITIGGIPIPKGARVFGVLASANRDEQIFGADADQFNPYRTSPKPQVGLGWGTHICMGRALESLITEPTFRKLATEMPGLRMPSTAQPPWFQDFYFRSFDHLTLARK